MRKRQRLALIVGDIDEGNTQAALQADQLQLQLLAQFEIQRRLRLIEQQDARPVDHGAGYRHPLALTTGKRCRVTAS